MAKLLVILFIVGTLDQLCQGRSTFYRPAYQSDTRFYQPTGNNLEYGDYYTSSATADTDSDSEEVHTPVTSSGYRGFHEAGNYGDIYNRLGSTGSHLSYEAPHLANFFHQFRHGYPVDPSAALRARVAFEMDRHLNLLRLEQNLKTKTSQGYDALFVKVLTRILQSSKASTSTSAVSRAQFEQLRRSLLEFLFPNTQLAQDFSVDLSGVHNNTSTANQTEVVTANNVSTTPDNATTTEATQTQQGIDSVDGDNNVYATRGSGSQDSNIEIAATEGGTASKVNAGQGGKDISQITANILPFLG